MLVGMGASLQRGLYFRGGITGNGALFFFSSRRRHTRLVSDWSSDVCSSDLHRCVPALVVLPGSAAEVATVVALCAQAGVPFVARGSGTGLSGGALPHKDGVLIVMSRMRSIDRKSVV